MDKIVYHIGGHTMRARDAALVSGDEDPREALVEAAIQTISTEIEIEAGGVKMHLAAWIDPDHWSDDWREALGLDDPDEAAECVDALLAEAMTEYVPLQPAGPTE